MFKRIAILSVVIAGLGLHVARAATPSAHLASSSSTNGVSVGKSDRGVAPPQQGATVEGLCQTIEQTVANRGIATSLCAKLQAFAADVAQGDAHAASGVLGAYLNELSAQVGKHITVAQAVMLAQLIIQLLP